MEDSIVYHGSLLLDNSLLGATCMYIQSASNSLQEHFLFDTAFSFGVILENVLFICSNTINIIKPTTSDKML